MSKLILAISYRELIQMEPMQLDVPGRRVKMDEAALFAVWVSQHQRHLGNLSFAFEGTSYLDWALSAWESFPDLVENGDPGGG